MLFKCQCIYHKALTGDTFQIELEFRNVDFWGEGNRRSSQRKTSRSKDKNQQQNQCTIMTPSPGVKSFFK